MAERRPLILDSDGTIRELPAGDSLPIAGGTSSSVPIAATDFVVAANTSIVAVDLLDISGSLVIDGNLGVI